MLSLQNAIRVCLCLMAAFSLAQATTKAPTEAPVAALNIPAGIFSQLPQVFPAKSSAYEDEDDYVPYSSDTHDQFSWTLLKQVLQEEHDNTMISPFSVKLILALLAEAAGIETQTKKELLDTFSEIKTSENLRSFYRKTLAAMKKLNTFYTLNLETKLYTDVAITPQQRYAALLQSFYDTEIEGLNFANPRLAADAINGWCNNVTHGRLQQLVTQQSIQNDGLLMANVIYFNGLWRRPFKSVFQGTFMAPASKQLKVDYMDQTEIFYYYESAQLNAKILRLPYLGKKFSMFILLPKSYDGVDDLLQHLQNDQLKNLQWMMEKTKIKLTLPKFKFVCKKNLKETLQHLGIKEVFSDHASLPGLAHGENSTGNLKVSSIYQKSGIDVNEKGTEAYASTVVEIVNKFGESTDTAEFKVDHPFVFFIEEESTGNILFAGKVLEPIV